MFHRTLAIIVESAAIYAVSAMIHIGLYAGNVNAQFVLYLVNTQLIAIVPTLILIRIGLGLTPTSGWDTAHTSSLPDSLGEALVTRQ